MGMWGIFGCMIYICVYLMGILACMLGICKYMWIY